MTDTATLRIQILVPRVLVQGRKAEALQAYLTTQGLWPTGVKSHRWRMDPATQGYVVELDVVVPVQDVPLPPQVQG
jgi:hypothetical protein